MLRYLLVFVFSMLSVLSYSQDKIRINSNIGYGYITGALQPDLPSDVERHNRKLKSGYVYEMDLGYDVNDVWGFGLYFSNFHSKDRASVGGGFLEEELEGVQVDLMSSIEMNFFAPKLYFMMLEDRVKHQLLTNVSLGYLRYSNDRIYGNNKQQVSANTFGLGLGVEYEYHLTSFLHLVSRFSTVVSFVSEFKVDDGEGERTVSVNNFTNGARDRENLSTVALSIGVRANILRPKLKKKLNEENDLDE